MTGSAAGPRSDRGEAGLTVVEVLVVIMILGLVIGVIGQVMLMTFTYHDEIGARNRVAVDAAFFTNTVIDDLVNATSSYEPYWTLGADNPTPLEGGYGPGPYPGGAATSMACASPPGWPVLEAVMGSSWDFLGAKNALWLASVRWDDGPVERRVRYRAFLFEETATPGHYRVEVWREYDADASTPAWDVDDEIVLTGYCRAGTSLVASTTFDPPTAHLVLRLAPSPGTAARSLEIVVDRRDYD